MDAVPDCNPGAPRGKQVRFLPDPPRQNHDDHKRKENETVPHPPMGAAPDGWVAGLYPVLSRFDSCRSYYMLR